MQNSGRHGGHFPANSAWLLHRAKHAAMDLPLNVYEVHLGSWRRGGDGKHLSCREIAEWLIPYVKQMGFTHVHLLPVAEHKPDDSWGYQCTNPFAVDGRYGTAQEFACLVNDLHRAGIGVFLDWVCPDLPEDAAIECALAWVEQYHIDGLRPVFFHPEANAVLPRRLINAFHAAHPDVCIIDNSHSCGDQGFSLSRMDPFSFLTAPPQVPAMVSLSHDEVSPGRGSLLSQMPGSTPEKYAGVRALYTCMLALPCKTLTMMGTEFGQWNPWNSAHSLDWHLLDQTDEDGERHRQLQMFFRYANDFYLKTPALWQQDFAPEGFCPLGSNLPKHVYTFLRFDKRGQAVLVAANLSPDISEHCRIGVPSSGRYLPVFHTDQTQFGGENRFPPFLNSDPIPLHGMEQSLTIDLPPLCAVILKCPRNLGKK